MKLRVAIVLTSLSLVAVACGGSSDDSTTSGTGTPKGTPTDLADLPSALAKAYCGGIAGCCNAKMYAYDQAKCVSLLTGIYAGVLPSSPDKATYDPVQGGDCVAAVAAGTATCMSSPGSPAACDAMFVGKVAEGGACEGGFECAKSTSGDTTCDYGSGKVGMCKTTPIGKAGDACGATCTKNGTDIDCTTFGTGSGSGPKPGPAECLTNDGLYCDSSTYQCKSIAKLGGECTSTDGCATGGFCAQGKCSPPLAQGTKCSFGDLCEGGYCDAFGDKTCKAAKKVGDACTSSEECGTGGHCVSHSSNGGDAKCESSDDLVSPGLCAGTGF